MATLMFECSWVNCWTSFFMYGPSPPVKPFQKARLTLGPSYLPVYSPPVSPPPAPGGPELPPPQAAAANPAAPTAADTPRKLRRVKELSDRVMDGAPSAGGRGQGRSTWK